VKDRFELALFGLKNLTTGQLPISDKSHRGASAGMPGLRSLVLEKPMDRADRYTLSPVRPFPLTPAALRPAVKKPRVSRYSDDSITPGEKAGWTVTLPQSATSGSHYTYTVKKNNFDVVAAGAIDLSSGSATIGTSLSEPAMLYVEVKPDAPPAQAGSNGAAPAAVKHTAIHLGAAIAPSQLQPSVPRPADFDAFWDGKRKALAAIPINPALTPSPTDKPGVELYTVKLDSLGSHVQGYLARPAKAGKFPALVVFEWAGVHALQPATVTDRAAEGWLAFNVDSHDLPPSQATGVGTGYQAIGNTDRETCYFLNMYLRDSRAIDYIASRPDWDGKNIVVMGTSMGGHQSLAAAGLNPHVTAVIVNEPAGADSNGDLHGRKAGYPNWDSTNPKVMETALYFDTVNFASRIKAPVMAAMGFIDIRAASPR
jgi:cephalosporin-C deacetylase